MDVGGGYCKSVLCSADMLVENLEPRTQNSQDLQMARQSCTQPYPQPLRECSVKAVYLLMAREKLVEVFYVLRGVGLGNMHQPQGPSPPMALSI